ncbi:RNA 2',3'-cyclic phosphodiesterase [Streptomyces albidochromogenes]|uniref:RNA 2',3'-cyclic phosphodiesterase n=1 Tax=Streptomyces albidochromogenes TaxID=329524 RepID=A0ABW6FSY9_9ACTN
MRLFAAVLPPAEAVDELAVAVQRLHALPGHDGLRWTGHSGWHYTLAFLGEVDDDLLPAVEERFGRAAARQDPFPLRVHGGGHFGNRALWAGAAGGLDAMRMLADRAHAAARRAGVPMEEHRAYKAHLTIARSRTGSDTDLRPYADALAGFESTAWTVRELALVRSNPPTPGVPGAQPRYEALRVWGLGG